MPNPEEFLAAGASLSVKDKLKDESRVDTISARQYRHPALGERPVVRLTPDNLAEGEDLTMEFLGFAKPEVTGPVAKRQRQALGFPGWAIVNDPKHARYALEIVKEFKRAVRRSKAKPGFGYDEFTEISKRLGKSVAHFLPSFWEQAGREFIALDNATYGSRCFGKAREAEKVHALKVDEKLRQEAFLEFALAGAVSIKAITEYGKELVASHEPKAAWKFFRELCVRRTLGGMPPWTSLVKDVQPLIKAAGLKLDDEVESILLEVIDSPAISRASMGFWEGASKVLGQLVKKNPHVAGVLLNLIPQTSTYGVEDIWPWLKHLEGWGILANAWKEDVAAAAGPQGGPAAWLNRLMRTFENPKQPIYDIVSAMADRLKKDKVPVDLYLKRRWANQLHGDVDLLDMALDLKIPLVEMQGTVYLDLKHWAEADGPDAKIQNRPRNPIHLVGDARFTTAMREAVQSAAGEYSFEVAARGKSALKSARQDWLQNLVDGLSSGGLPRLEESLKLLENRTRPPIFEEFPDVLKRLQETNVIPAIARTIRGGLLDEYGWPALEKAYDAFVAANKSEPAVFGQFPYLILTDKQKAIVLKGEQIVHEAELKVPKGHELKQILFVDGDLLVWAGAGYQTRSFWNSDPQPSDEGYNYFPPALSGTSVDLPGGGTFIGEKVIHRGHKELERFQCHDMLVADGTHWWMRSAEWHPQTYSSSFVLTEVDPVTGKPGRRSLPSFFEDFVADGWQLEVEHCSLLPVGDAFPKSPLGVRDGLAGSRVRRSTSGKVRIEGIDGRACEVETKDYFSWLLDQPGTAAQLPVQARKEYGKPLGFDLWDPTGQYEVATVSGGVARYSRGQLVGFPTVYLHALQVRDLATSKKLRNITDKDVQTLLAAEQQDFQKFLGSGQKGTEVAGVMQRLPDREEAANSPLLDAAIRKLLGDGIHPRLLAGLRGVLITGGQKTRQLAKLVENRSTAPEAETPVLDLLAADAASAPFLGTIRPGYGATFRMLPNLSFMECVSEATLFFTGELTSLNIPQDWLTLLRKLTAGTDQRLWMAYCTDPADEDWIRFAELWSTLPYRALPGTFRIFTSSNRDFSLFEAEKKSIAEKAVQAGKGHGYTQWGIPLVGKTSRYLIEANYNGFEVLEYSPNGQFEAIPSLPEIREWEVIVPPVAWSGEQLLEFVKLAKAGPLPYPPVDVLKSLAEELNVSVAEVALVWFGLPGMEIYTANFMPTHLREKCKLKTKECSAAKEALKQMPPNLLNSLTRAVVSGTPADLWEQPPQQVANRLRSAWQGERSDRLQLSSEWVEKLSSAFPSHFKAGPFFQAWNAPLTDPLFSDKGNWKFGRGSYWIELACDEPTCTFNNYILQAATISIALLGYGHPAGESVRKMIQQLQQGIDRALSNPQLLLFAGSRYGVDAAAVEKLKAQIESMVGKFKPQGNVEVAENGLVTVARDQLQIQVAFRPAATIKPADLERLSNQLKALLTLTGSPSDVSSESFNYVRVLRSSDFRAIIERAQKTPVPEGGYETNPQQSGSDVVKQVAKKHKLSDDAAAYYLQLLTLADPTDKNVMQWNGWTAATIKAAGAELIDKKLVLEASRSRAGRKYFLPGGWEDLKAPHLPIETWKMPLFQLARDDSQRATPPLSRIVPLEPVHTLFAKAWNRIVEGDVPKYEEVK